MTEVKTPDTRDRFRGALLGLAVGDALGATLEFKTRDTYPPLTDMIGGGPFNLKPGEWTDDTSMALCLADSLIAEKTHDARDQLTRYARWCNEDENSVKGRCFDIGTTCRSAISRFLQTGSVMAVGMGDTWASNGSIMRLAPAVMFGAKSLNFAVELSRASSLTTHSHPDCVGACELLGARIALALRIDCYPHAPGESIAHQIAADIEGAKLPRRGWSSRLRTIWDGGYKPLHRNQIKSGGGALDTLEAALWAVSSQLTFRDALLTAANLGSDSDTVGAVCGQLAGAWVGMSGIPPEWLDKLAWRDKIIERADALYALSGIGG